MKVVSLVGARPQFIKASLLSEELKRADVDEVMVHSGQHYDYNMSAIFFDELKIKNPDHFLDVGSGSHAVQTAAIMTRLEPILLEAKPDWVIVFGDTNTTLAGALTAAKLNLAVAHVEAGLRSFNSAMPEEINRIVADHVSKMLFAPNARALEQLTKEGLSDRSHVVGDLMVDLLLRVRKELDPLPDIIRKYDLRSKHYALATVHRAGNTDDVQRLAPILQGLQGLDMPVVFPIHPRTSASLTLNGINPNHNIHLIPPVSFKEMVALEQHASVILTDSGGVQKEAYVLGVPCVTLREETEWAETLDDGWNVLAGHDPMRISELARRPVPTHAGKERFGDGHTAERITSHLKTRR